MSTVVLADDFKGYSVESFSIPKCYLDDLDHVLIPEGLARDRTRRLAQEVHGVVGNQALYMLGILKGSYRFFTALEDCLTAARVNSDFPILVDFIRLRSYTDTHSTGKVEVVGADPLTRLRGANVLVVEDIVDTGQTISRLLTLLAEHAPASVRVVSLLHKRTPNSSGYKPDFVGFEIPDRFVVGYGLDYNEFYRDLNHISVLNSRAVQKYSSESAQNGVPE